MYLYLGLVVPGAFYEGPNSKSRLFSVKWFETKQVRRSHVRAYKLKGLSHVLDWAFDDLMDRFRPE